jgi:hypothetical protein
MEDINFLVEYGRQEQRTGAAVINTGADNCCFGCTPNCHWRWHTQGWGYCFISLFKSISQKYPLPGILIFTWWYIFVLIT